MAKAKTKIDEWLSTQTENGSVSIRTQKLSCGELGPNKYDLFFWAEQPHEILSPVLLLRAHSAEASTLPPCIVLCIVENDTSREIASCPAEPVYSIINKDYASSYRFPVNEDDLMKVFRKESALNAVLDGIAYSIPINTDDSLPFIRLKNKLAPGTLNEEQKAIILREKKEADELVRQENEQQRKQKKEKELRKNQLLQEFATRFAEKLILRRSRLKQDEVEELAESIASSLHLITERYSYRRQYLTQNKDILLRLDEVQSILEKKCGFDGGKLPFSSDDGVDVQDVADLLAGRISLQQLQQELYGALPQGERTKLVTIYSKPVFAEILKEKKTDSIFRLFQFSNVFKRVMGNPVSESLNTSKIGFNRLAKSLRFETDVRFFLQDKQLMGSGADVQWVDRELTLQQAYDVIDGIVSYADISPRLLVARCIRKATLVNKAIGKEYRIYYDGLYPKRDVDLLVQKGIISPSDGLEYFDDGSSTRSYRVLYVTDFQTACEILEGKQMAPVKNNGGSSNGCFVATCVYGSYDCPEVWTLRRFRDQSLRNSWLGRVFIRSYYATSPTLVKWFGEKEAFRAVNRRILDKCVSTLNRKGYDNKPYEDR